MLLKDILKGVCYIGDAPLETEVKDIVYNSKYAAKDVLFVALVGANCNGHNYVEEAYDKGCRMFLCQYEVALPDDATVLLVEVTRHVLSSISDNFFGHPSEKIKVIGVTGTKGKTTTVNMVKDVLNHCGVKTGCIGTVGATWGNKFRKTINTTPESYEIHKLLSEMIEDGCEAVAIEVSSLGVMMHRVDNVKFAIGVFTNISLDHIGGNEHKTFEEYYGWKKAFFDKCDYAIGCYDDEATEDMLEKVKEKVFYGFDKKSDLCASNIKPYKNEEYLGSEFDLKISDKLYKGIKISMPGEYSVYNALATIAICNRLNVNVDDMREALTRIKVSGRTQPVVINDNYSIFIDYAHNGASLKQVLSTLRDYKPNRILCLFGSVGGRAQLRRKEMGLVAGKLCDLSIITSDDPNYEEPQAIIDEIADYVSESGGEYVKIVDRQEAIEYAIEILQQGDILILCGKGHEKYQKVRGELIPLDEQKCIMSSIEKFNK